MKTDEIKVDRSKSATLFELFGTADRVDLFFMIMGTTGGVITGRICYQNFYF